jgi:hypothetical protein
VSIGSCITGPTLPPYPIPPYPFSYLLLAIAGLTEIFVIRMDKPIIVAINIDSSLFIEKLFHVMIMSVNAFQLIKEHQLEKQQGKVEYFENQIFMLELQRTESMNKIQNLNRMKDELQSSMAQRRGEIDYMN